MSDSNTWRARAHDYDMWSRRRYLVATVGIAALSGCGGDTGGEKTTEPQEVDGDETAESGGAESEELPAGVSEEEFEHGPVPDVYVSAMSLGDEQRDVAAEGRCVV